MNKRMRIALLAALATLVVTVGVLSTRYLPRGEVVELTGAQNMRFSNGVDDGSEHAEHGKASRDVRLIYARTTNGKSVRTYRNEDIGIYLKFDSGSLNSKVQSILLDQSEKGHPVPVLALYYGWRLPWYSMYPNLISVREVAADYTYIPWPFMLICAIVLGGLGAIGYFVRRAWLFSAAKTREVSESMSSNLSRGKDSMAGFRPSLGRGAQTAPPPVRPVPHVSTER